MAKVNPKQAGIAAAALAAILGSIYASEGGHVNDPTDRGGETNYGVTIEVARKNGYVGAMRDFPKHCYGKVTVCADKIYIDKYIKAPGFEPFLTIEPAVAWKLTDIGVNMGPAWPSSWLQIALVSMGENIATDAKVGPATIAAYRRAQARYGKVKACEIVVASLAKAQESRYLSIIKRNPSQVKYRNGWLRRARHAPPIACGAGE